MLMLQTKKMKYWFFGTARKNNFLLWGFDNWLSLLRTKSQGLTKVVWCLECLRDRSLTKHCELWLGCWKWEVAIGDSIWAWRAIWSFCYCLFASIDWIHTAHYSTVYNHASYVKGCTFGKYASSVHFLQSYPRKDCAKLGYINCSFPIAQHSPKVSGRHFLCYWASAAHFVM